MIINFFQPKSSIQQFKPVISFSTHSENREPFYSLAPYTYSYVLEDHIQAKRLKSLLLQTEPSQSFQSILTPRSTQRWSSAQSKEPFSIRWDKEHRFHWIAECSLELSFLDTAFAFPSSDDHRREQQKSVCLAASYRIHMSGAQHAVLCLSIECRLFPDLPALNVSCFPIFVCAFSLLWHFDERF